MIDDVKFSLRIQDPHLDTWTNWTLLEQVRRWTDIMAGDDHYLHPANPIFDNMMMDPAWEFSPFPAMPPSSSLRTGESVSMETDETLDLWSVRSRSKVECSFLCSLIGASLMLRWTSDVEVDWFCLSGSDR
ncbi:hypothetical protein INR49_009046 [Caranx melampygus]|nr:hypothetical protein INR49_009046 [Caranx melampygus]